MYDLSTTTMIWEDWDLFATTMIYASHGRYRSTCMPGLNTQTQESMFFSLSETIDVLIDDKKT